MSSNKGSALQQQTALAMLEKGSGLPDHLQEKPELRIFNMVPPNLTISM